MKVNTKKIAGIGLLTAVVVVLQLLGSFIKFGPFSISLVLIPIVVGAALYGKSAGVWLGAAFAVSVLASGDAGMFLAVNPAGAVITVAAKGIIAGLVSALVYDLIKKRSQTAAAVTAAIVCPVFNTGVFLIGCALFFMSTIEKWAENAGFGSSVGTYMVVGLVGLNFVFELLVNVLLSPIIIKIIDLGKRKSK